MQDQNVVRPEPPPISPSRQLDGTILTVTSMDLRATVFLILLAAVGLAGYFWHPWIWFLAPATLGPSLTTPTGPARTAART